LIEGFIIEVSILYKALQKKCEFIYIYPTLIL
jgi:hypothetical protein